MLDRRAFGLLALLAAGGAACSGQVSTGAGGSGAGATSGPSATTSASGGTGASTTTTSATTAASSGGGCAKCAAPFTCCSGVCAYLQNDILNCGACGTVCPGAAPYCHNGVCSPPPCTQGQQCPTDETCCNGGCCAPGQLCCDVPGPISNGPSCQTPVGGTCPQGCPECKCAAPDTPIATPEGPRRIADIAVGDLVYSVDGDAIVAVPVLRTNRAPVAHHEMVRVTLAGGAVIEMSPGHPTADGRTFGDLHAGDTLDHLRVVTAERVPYQHPFTYDILPASGTRTYFAAGARVGTTLVR